MNSLCIRCRCGRGRSCCRTVTSSPTACWCERGTDNGLSLEPTHAFCPAPPEQVWSTGVGPTPFTVSLPLLKTRAGRIAVDQYLRASLLPRGSLAGGHGDPNRDPSPPPAANWKARMTAQGLEDPGDGPFRPASPEEGKERLPELRPGEDQPVVCDFIFSCGDCSANLDQPLPALAQVCLSWGGPFRLSGQPPQHGFPRSIPRRGPGLLVHASNRLISGLHPWVSVPWKRKEENMEPARTLAPFQVAEQQGRYLARVLNARAREPDQQAHPPEPFSYRSLGESLLPVSAANPCFGRRVGVRA